MPRFHLQPGSRAIAFSALIFSFNFLSGLQRNEAEPGPTNLQLEVFINGVPANMISSFVQYGDGKIGATQSELEELGLRSGLKRGGTEVVLLDEIPTLKYEYVEQQQRILITIGDAYRIPHVFDLRQNSPARAPPAQTGWGAVLNYDLLTTSGNVYQAPPSWFGGTSLTLDGRAFSPYGTLGQSALLSINQNESTEVTRLDTSYRYSDQNRLITGSVGDFVTGGLAWTRPIRVGGVQAASNFALRPDLVTMPLPTLGGTAAVPSTVDVYVNNIKTFSQDVGPGPFTVSNVPLVSGAGNAQLVVRDSSGQETKTSLPFYAAASLLAPGLMSWSVEAGAPRVGYGSTADNYVETPVASATLRRGIFDWLTAEGHAEGGSGLANGGVGAAIRTGTIGVAELAVAGSALSSGDGLQAYLSYDTRLFGLNIHASLQRTVGYYNDLASATARLQDITASSQPLLGGFFGALPVIQTPSQVAALYASALPPRELYQLSAGAAVPFDRKASWNLSFLHELDALNNLSNILSVSYSRALPHNASFFATAFSDFGTNRSTGIVAGLSIPFGVLGAVTSSVSSGQGGTTGTVDAVKSLGPAIGDYGWEVRDTEGAAPYRTASFSYRSSFGTAKVGVSQDQTNVDAGLELRGSIIGMGGHVFFSDWVNDAFAVVDAGAPGVEVSYENRPIGKTDAQGMLLVPTLRAYQRNMIAIDPANLPVDAEIANTRDVVAPADRAGVLVRFKLEDDSNAALVVFVRADGGFVPAGAAGKIADGEEFVVGYDGQAFIRNLKAANTAVIQFKDTSCQSNFNFAAQRNEQVHIGPVPCQ